MNKIIPLLWAAWLCFSLNAASAQTKGAKISGSVTDAAKKPVDAATVLLFTAKDSVLVKTELTNPDGSFAFLYLKDNTYFIKITCISYKNYRSAPVVISGGQAISLPVITLISAGKTLKDVTVTGQRAFIEQKIDRTVVNVNALISNTGTSALEVLEKTPGVIVDENGNITFKGKSGVLVMIDDKPTYLSPANLATYLRSLPSTALDQIELMDNPPAKYDAAGNAGVINIKTKKNTLRGFNGSVSLSYAQGFYSRNIESINLNYRVNKVNVFANASYNYVHSYRRLDLNRDFLDANGNPAYFNNSSYFRPITNNTDFKAGVDYYQSPKTTWGIVFTGTLSPDHDNSPVNSFLYGKDHTLDSTINTNNSSKDKFNSGGINLNYSHKFDSTGREITFDLDYVRDVAGSDQTFVNNTYLPNGNLTTSQTLTDNLPSYINIYAAKTDFTLPIKHKAKLEAGLKSSYVNTDNAANYFNVNNGISTPDYNSTNRFLYKENINAAYINYNRSFNRLELQAGLRAENTNGNGHQLGNVEKKDSTFANHYTDLFPTAYLSYKMDTAGHHLLVLSYGRRVGRPSYGSLNPFTFFVDKFTYFSGNPFLKPEFTDNYKLAYSYKSLLTLALTYSYTTDYQTETISQDGDIFISTTGNIGERKNIDVSANSNLNPAKWWSVNLYAEAYRNSFTGPLYTQRLNLSGNSFSANANNQFNLSNGWTAELGGFYNSRRVNGQFILNPSGMVNGGIQKKILQNKGSIKLGQRDVFHSFRSDGVITGIPQASSTFYNYLDTRVTTLTFTYNFGKDIKSPPKRETGSADSEKDRAH